MTSFNHWSKLKEVETFRYDHFLKLSCEATFFQLLLAIGSMSTLPLNRESKNVKLSIPIQESSISCFLLFPIGYGILNEINSGVEINILGWDPSSL